MKKQITVLTATRAEYGLLSSVIKKLLKEPGIRVRVAVTGMHLSPEFGLTYREIEMDGVPIDKKIEILMGADTAVSVSKSMGLAMIGFAEYFDETRPDALLVLGDRYETLAVCCAAMNARIPVIHLYGGETTEGAVDEAIRHSITKMSYLHLTSTELYRKRVIQLGEQPDRVFCVGSLGVENVLSNILMSKDELADSLQLSLDGRYAVVTYHPVTLEDQEIENEMRNLFAALEEFADLSYIVTKANADVGGRIVNQMWDEYAKKHQNVVVFESLGMKRYLTAVKYSRMVIGNSSSGLLEVPSFGIPTINVGDRQKGRLRAESVIDCDTDTESIVTAITQAETEEFRKFCETVKNPYEKENTADEIVRLIIEKVLFSKIDLKKKFWDLEEK